MAELTLEQKLKDAKSGYDVQALVEKTKSEDLAKLDAEVLKNAMTALQAERDSLTNADARSALDLDTAINKLRAAPSVAALGTDIRAILRGSNDKKMLDVIGAAKVSDLKELDRELLGNVEKYMRKQIADLAPRAGEKTAAAEIANYTKLIGKLDGREAPAPMPAPTVPATKRPAANAFEMNLERAFAQPNYQSRDIVAAVNASNPEELKTLRPDLKAQLIDYFGENDQHWKKVYDPAYAQQVSDWNRALQTLNSAYQVDIGADKRPAAKTLKDNQETVAHVRKSLNAYLQTITNDKGEPFPEDKVAWVPLDASLSANQTNGIIPVIDKKYAFENGYIKPPNDGYLPVSVGSKEYLMIPLKDSQQNIDLALSMLRTGKVVNAGGYRGSLPVINVGPNTPDNQIMAYLNNLAIDRNTALLTSKVAGGGGIWMDVNLASIRAGMLELSGDDVKGILHYVENGVPAPDTGKYAAGNRPRPMTDKEALTVARMPKEVDRADATLIFKQQTDYSQFANAKITGSVPAGVGFVPGAGMETAIVDQMRLAAVVNKPQPKHIDVKFDAAREQYNAETAKNVPLPPRVGPPPTPAMPLVAPGGPKFTL